MPPSAKLSHSPRSALRAYLSDFNFLENLADLGTNVRVDVLSGVTVAMVVLPMALAFGVATGLGASAGLWAAIAAGLVAGPLSGFAWSVGGPTGPMTIQLLAILAVNRTAAGTPNVDLATASVCLAGLILIGLGAMKLGRFIRYTPYSVVSGFMTGLGLIYVILQINPFFGIPSAANISAALVEIPRLAQDMNTDAAVVGGLTLASTLAWSRFVRISFLPAPLIGLSVGVGLSALPGMDVPMIDAVPTAMPTLHIPDLNMIHQAMVPGATLAALCVFDSLLTALIVDNLTSTRHNSDRELVAQGAANLCSGLVGGIGSATNTMPCVVSVNSGAKTRLSTIVMGLTLLSLAVGLGSLAAYVPMPALAAILTKAGWDIIDQRVLRVVRALPRSDKMSFALVVVSTVLWDLLSAMALGLAIAFFRFVKDSADRYECELETRASALDREREQILSDLVGRMGLEALQEQLRGGGADLSDPERRDLLLRREIRARLQTIRPHGPLFFGAVSWLQETVQGLAGKEVLLVDCAELDSVDLSGAYALADLIEAATRDGLTVVVSGLQPTTEHVLEDLKELKNVPPGCRFAGFEEALQWAVGEIEARAHGRRVRGTPRADGVAWTPSPAA